MNTFIEKNNSCVINNKQTNKALVQKIILEEKTLKYSKWQFLGTGVVHTFFFLLSTFCVSQNFNIKYIVL